MSKRASKKERDPTKRLGFFVEISCMRSRLSDAASPPVTKRLLCRRFSWWERGPYRSARRYPKILFEGIKDILCYNNLNNGEVND